VRKVRKIFDIVGYLSNVKITSQAERKGLYAPSALDESEEKKRDMLLMECKKKRSWQGVMPIGCTSLKGRTNCAGGRFRAWSRGKKTKNLLDRN